MPEKFDFIDNEQFEQKVIINLIFDNRFLDDIIQIIEPEYFNKAHNRWIVQAIIEYYNEHAKPITAQALAIKLKNDNEMTQGKYKLAWSKIVNFIMKIDVNNESKGDEYLQRAHTFVENMLKDKETVQEETQSFCSTKRWVKAITRCAEYVGSEKESEIPSIMSQVEMQVDPIHIGTDFGDMEARKDAKAREGLIPTPWKALNDYVKGVGENELACWVAGMGSGKSTHASNIALHAFKKGYNVVLYTLELGENYNRQRIDSIMMGVETEELDKVDVEGRLNKYKSNGGTLTIKKFGTGITAHTITNHFNRLRARGKDPDLFIIDYLDLMDSIHPMHNKKKDWEKFGEVTKEIRNEICFKEQVAGHAFVQGNTSAIQDFVIRADSSSGGARRLFPADVVIGLARPDELKAQEKINLSIIKNRFGADGFYLKGETDYSIGKAEYYAGANYSVAGDQDVHVKEQLGNDYKSYKKTKRQTQAGKKVKDPNELSFG